jgi:hypothetical protein
MGQVFKARETGVGVVFLCCQSPQSCGVWLGHLGPICIKSYKTYGKFHFLCEPRDPEMSSDSYLGFHFFSG